MILGQIEIAKGIADYGFMAVMCAFTLSAMFAMFKFFMSTLKKLLDKQEGAYLYETPMEQIRVLQSALFDLSKFQVLEQLDRIYKENTLDDKKYVTNKVLGVLTNVHHDRNSKLDNFKYHGIKLSEFTSEKWIEKVQKVCMECIYAEPNIFNHKRSYSALDIVYNDIKLQFYNNILMKS